MTKFLLSTGQSTSKVEEYVLDLVNLYLKINPGDIPHRSDFGSDFTFTDVMKDELSGEISYRLNSLVDKIKSRVSGISLSIESIFLIDEETVKLVLQINGKLSEGYYINLYE